ncbi:universal stress protein [Georgenia deserti]|uniref:Universal stress protein n=1 Tax=Georgenia deserti TaxID=2093781 RepID=A0ABW4L5G6_9MICO
MSDVTVLVGFADSAEGRVAFDAGVEEARLRSTGVIVLVMSGEPPPVVHDVPVEFRHPDRHDADVAGALLDLAEETSAELIVIGLRRRSPVGKLLLGSQAQQILLQARVPVLAVKTPAAG